MGEQRELSDLSDPLANHVRRGAKEAFRLLADDLDATGEATLVPWAYFRVEKEKDPEATVFVQLVFMEPGLIRPHASRTAPRRLAKAETPYKLARRAVEMVLSGKVPGIEKGHYTPQDLTVIHGVVCAAPSPVLVAADNDIAPGKLVRLFKQYPKNPLIRRLVRDVPVLKWSRLKTLIESGEELQQGEVDELLAALLEDFDGTEAERSRISMALSGLSTFFTQDTARLSGLKLSLALEPGRPVLPEGGPLGMMLQEFQEDVYEHRVEDDLRTLRLLDFGLQRLDEALRAYAPVYERWERAEARGVLGRLEQLVKPDEAREALGIWAEVGAWQRSTLGSAESWEAFRAHYVQVDDELSTMWVDAEDERDLKTMDQACARARAAREALDATSAAVNERRKRLERWASLLSVGLLNAWKQEPESLLLHQNVLTELEKFKTSVNEALGDGAVTRESARAAQARVTELAKDLPEAWGRVNELCGHLATALATASSAAEAPVQEAAKALDTHLGTLIRGLKNERVEEESLKMIAAVDSADLFAGFPLDSAIRSLDVFRHQLRAEFPLR